MDRFIRFSLWSGVVGGLLLAAGSLVTLATAGGQPMSARALTTSFALAAAIQVAGMVGLLVGVGGIAASAARAGGSFLLVAYVATMGALALNLGWMWADLFLSDTVSRVAPQVLDGTDDAVVGRLGIGMLVAWLANLGFLLLAVAVRRTLPRTTWVALALAGIITLEWLPMDGAAYNVVIGACLAAAAWATARQVPQAGALVAPSAAAAPLPT